SSAKKRPAAATDVTPSPGPLAPPRSVPVAAPPATARSLAGSPKDRAAAVTKVAAAARRSQEKEGEITVTGPALGMSTWMPGRDPNIQVAVATSDMCAVLENAALLHANGQ